MLVKLLGPGQRGLSIRQTSADPSSELLGSPLRFTERTAARLVNQIDAKAEQLTMLQHAREPRVGLETLRDSPQGRLGIGQPMLLLLFERTMERRSSRAHIRLIEWLSAAPTIGPRHAGREQPVPQLGDRLTAQQAPSFSYVG
ncbi:MAG TPA: hypothetical protein VF984_09330 [Actinomycetota bacterium]